MELIRQLVVVRHAPVSAAGLCYGRTDVAVTVPAPRAARTIVDRLPWLPDAIWTSPLARARDAARCLAEMLRTPLTIDERLRELDHGEWDGRSWEDIERTDGDRLAAWMADWIRGRPPGGESVADIERRVGAWLADLGPGPVAVVAHAGVIRAMWVLLEGLSWSEAIEREVHHLEPVVLRR